MKRIAPALLLVLPLSLLAATGKFGAPLGDSPKVALADLVKDPAAWSGKTVKTPGGKPDAIKGDQKELSFVASGVELARPSR